MNKKSTKFLALTPLAAILLSASWKLPPTAVIKGNGTRIYRFLIDYTYSDLAGHIRRRERVSADYTRGLPGDERAWNRVSVAQAPGADSPFGPAENRPWMENFRYRMTDPSETTKPGFFKALPPTALQERNLVWDTQMFETFGQTQFGHLRLNEPYPFISSQDVQLAGSGTFRNKDVQLTWIGFSERNHKRCALIDYRAFFNPLQITSSGFDFKGRSHYWGQIWVATSTRQIEYGTLYEDVLGEVKLPNQDAPLITNVFRSGTFEPISAH